MYIYKMNMFFVNSVFLKKNWFENLSINEFLTSGKKKKLSTILTSRQSQRNVDKKKNHKFQQTFGLNKCKLH